MRANRVTLFVLVLLLAAGNALAGQKRQSLTDEAAAVGETSFGYKFEGARFYINLIEVDIAPNGTGEVRFKRGESDEVLDCKINLLPATISRIRGLFQVTQFLTSVIEYQGDKDFSHLGWITLSAKKGAKERKVRFNFTKNAEIKELQEIFRGIATQEISLFDIENAERYQPLDLPKQLELLESDLRLAQITEPTRLLAPLHEISGDDTLPLIARNHAKRIAEAIKNGKYKSPIKR